MRALLVSAIVVLLTITFVEQTEIIYLQNHSIRIGENNCYFQYDEKHPVKSSNNAVNVYPVYMICAK